MRAEVRREWGQAEAQRKRILGKISFLYRFLKLGYVHYTGRGGFTVTIPIRLIFYISYIAPIVFPRQPPLCPT
jgi:hypothetical protein